MAVLTQAQLDALIQSLIRDNEGGTKEGKQKIRLDSFDRIFTDISDTLFGLFGAEDATYEDLPAASTLTITCSKKRHYRKTKFTDATNITGITLSGLTNGMSIDHWFVNGSGSQRSITIPTGAKPSAGSKSQTYFNAGTGIITLEANEELKMFTEHSGEGLRTFFEKA